MYKENLETSSGLVSSLEMVRRRYPMPPGKMKALREALKMLKKIIF